MRRTGEALRHVCWLGGSACAGKTAVARLLSERRGSALYSCDDHFEEHRKRASPERHPRFYHLMDLPVERLWSQPAEEQARDLLGFYADEFEMVLEDLAAMSGPVLAEGVGLLPDLLAAIPVDPRRAVWLLSSEAFRLRAYPQRGSYVEEMLSRYDDPERTFREWMRRDSLVADFIADGARRMGGTILSIEGSRSVEQMAEALIERFSLKES
ncbi:MAG TPA: hypothetical protein VGX68_09640 [Thermoanaerobaculia bacterium]|nr:hypothetical protein [Thermoanaerobaculia bacterium]